MASMTTLFVKFDASSKPIIETRATHLKTGTRFQPKTLLIAKKKWARSICRASCNLIEPDGGKLVDLVVPEGPVREGKRLEAMTGPGPRIKLSRIDLEWVHVLSEGWASPLGGFMREAEFLQTLHFNSLRLADGSVVNMSVPIVLAIDDEQKQAIGDCRKITLVDSENRPVATLNE